MQGVVVAARLDVDVPLHEGLRMLAITEAATLTGPASASRRRRNPREVGLGVAAISTGIWTLRAVSGTFERVLPAAPRNHGRACDGLSGRAPRSCFGGSGANRLVFCAFDLSASMARSSPDDAHRAQSDGRGITMRLRKCLKNLTD